MNERFGIETSTTPAEAPYANGVVERGNKVLFESMMKTKEDEGCDTETALAWAVSAKNCLQNVYGFSPNQLVLSQNVTLPNVIDSEPPALESHTSCDLVRQNLNAMHSAREQFVKAESSDKIKRALLKNVRTYSEVDFQSGEKVYFRRKNLKGWKGPGKVLGKEGNFVLIRYGAAYYRCHPCDLMKALPSNVHKKEHNILIKEHPILKFEEILFYGDDNGSATIGTPYVKDVVVTLKVIDVIKDKKVLIFKKKRRHNYRRKLGHRQNVVLLKVTDIFQKSKKKNISEEKPEVKSDKKKTEINQSKE